MLKVRIRLLLVEVVNKNTDDQMMRSVLKNKSAEIIGIYIIQDEKDIWDGLLMREDMF